MAKVKSPPMRSIRSGTWKLTRQGIGFDTNGRLVDGRLRLEVRMAMAMAKAKAKAKAKSPVMRVKLISVTPKMAAKFLERGAFARKRRHS